MEKKVVIIPLVQNAKRRVSGTLAGIWCVHQKTFALRVSLLVLLGPIAP